MRPQSLKSNIWKRIEEKTKANKYIARDPESKQTILAGKWSRTLIEYNSYSVGVTIKEDVESHIKNSSQTWLESCQSSMMDLGWQFQKKEIQAQLFSCECCELFKNSFFIEHLWCLLLIFDMVLNTSPLVKYALNILPMVTMGLTLL